MFSLTTHVRGNPDLGQDPKELPPQVRRDEVLTAPTLLELQRKVREWQAARDIGGGNWWSGTVVTRDVVTANRRSGRSHVRAELVGHMSYNGRIWTGNGTEVLAAPEVTP